ncbi:Uu.00g051100.m01.CDS01 [Anthostomella pinea]|uniref:Uu.00g051100.m01.CDS01 n=1 Tax=Anthostomella pinea TaxID=933095 RepID=A0AAI8VTZ0_9PEZI|nr:Uu.00g051100.m01.CDS01 [Anthostomella pinea]
MKSKRTFRHLTRPRYHHYFLLSTNQPKSSLIASESTQQYHRSGPQEYQHVRDLFLGCAVAYIAWSIACLETNVRKARSLKVPIVRLPIDSNNVFWIILQPHVWKFLDGLPFSWSSYPRFVRFSRRGWYFAERAEAHVQLGPVWALVSPIAINMHFADPDTIHDIVTRRGDFQRPAKELALLELYGPCISTAKWDDWPRHRKVMATPFNETIMKFVWEESVRQAKGMLHSWSSARSTGIPSYQKDTRTLSLNVLAATGFRRSYDFRGSAEPATDEIGSYRDSLQTVLDDIIPDAGTVPYPPHDARKRHMVEMLDKETTALQQGKPGSGTIMTSLVRAANMPHQGAATASDSDLRGAKKGLSADEVFGNLFVINFAGHDTTANTLAFAMLLLASRPDVQAWVASEIAYVTGDRPLEACDYNDLFPQLKRCRAVIYETLRLYPPVPALPSITSNGTQHLRIGDRTLYIPEGVNLTVNLRAMQVHPQYWSDGNVWQPSRWISNSAPIGSPSPSPDQLVREQFSEPSKSIFFPWGEGPQICPGKKFAEVEGVAVLASLFGGHRISAKKQSGESDEGALGRVDSCLNDVDLEMLLRLKDADQVTLVCEEA